MLLLEDARREAGRRVVIPNLDRPLRHDRAAVEAGVDEVHGTTGDADAVGQRLALGVDAGKGGKEAFAFIVMLECGFNTETMEIIHVVVAAFFLRGLGGFRGSNRLIWETMSKHWRCFQAENGWRSAPNGDLCTLVLYSDATAPVLGIGLASRLTCLRKWLAPRPHLPHQTWRSWATDYVG